MIKIKNLTVIKNNVYILKNISFFLEQSNIYALNGKNGIGKTTLAKCILNSSEYFFCGNIFFNKVNIKNYLTEFLSRIGIFYSHQLSINLNNIKNIFLLKTCFNIFNNYKNIFFKIINYYSKILNYNKKLLYKNTNINYSGGERKKTEFLFLVINNPIFIILDEIDSGLDYDSTIIIYNYINKNKNNKYIIIISHNKNISFFININYFILLTKKKILIYKCI